MPALTESHFTAAVDAARRLIPGLVPAFTDRLAAILQLAVEVRKRVGDGGGGGTVPTTASAGAGRAVLKDFSQLGGTPSAVVGKAAAPAGTAAVPPLVRELRGLLPARFLEQVSYERLPHLARYLKALQVRAERAALNPAIARERMAVFGACVEALRQLQTAKSVSAETRAGIEELRWMVEED